MSSDDILLNGLNSEQEQAVTHENGPLLIIAGAGTGKTTVITRRIAWLIREGKAKPDEILALTFTDKAANEMEERVDRLLPYGYVDLWIQTFHSFAEKILKAHALEIGLSSDLKLLDTTSQWMLIKENLEKLKLSYFRPLGNPTKFIHALIKHFSRLKDELVGSAEYLKYAENLRLNGDNTELLNEEAKRAEELSNAYHFYEQMLLEQGATDFGGLINWTVKLFKDRPAILKKYQAKFKYILVDEFQDTNYSQYELVKLLTSQAKNLTVVGDDDQAIYKFRGASISNILEFKKDFPESKEVYLVKNYRSSQNILDLSYKFIQQNNPYRLEVALGGALTLSKKLIAATELPAEIKVISTPNQYDEARAVRDKILDLKNSDQVLSWSDFAILVRANDHAAPFIRQFADSGIPHEFLASRGLYIKPVILDIISYLKILDNFHESTAVYRVLNFSCWQIPEEDVIKLLYWANRKSLPLFEAMRKAVIFGVFSEETLTKFNKIAQSVSRHATLAKSKDVSQVILGMLHDTGYLKDLLEKAEKGSNEPVRHLNQFWKKAQDFASAQNDPSVKIFLNRFNLEVEAGEEGALGFSAEDGPETVKIMTVHASKGLEFQHVFLVNLVDRRFPTSPRSEPLEVPRELIKETLPEGDVHLQEERRLFYVGATRAKRGLFFTLAADYGGARDKKPSRFLTEMGLLEEGETKTKKKNADFEAKKEDIIPEDKKLEAKIPSKFSFTQIKAFETCPKQYKYAHILKIPVSGRQTFSFGQTMHLTFQRILEKLVERSGGEQTTLFGDELPAPSLPTLSEALAIYEATWIGDWYATSEAKEEYYEKGKRIVKRFHEEVSLNPPKITALELPFTLKIGDALFKGKIDRIDLKPDGTVEIIDYKTGASRDLKNISKDQLLLYQIAAEEVLFPQGSIPGRPSALAFHYVEDGNKVSFLGEPEEVQKFKNKVTSLLTELKSSSFAATPSTQVCNFCDFKDICESRKI